jgi:Protein of unknown function (DUF2933)
MKDMNMHEPPQREGWFESKRITWVLLGFLAIGAFFLITEHTAHLLGFLPYLLFLLCPLMMFFMHGGHGGHGDHNNHDGSGTQSQEQPPEGGQQ